MNDLETQPSPHNDSNLEDITDLVWQALDHLADCEFLAKGDFDLLETMSAFESMDKKMDVRVRRGEAASIVANMDKEMPNEPEKMQALLEETLIQLAAWQSQNAQVQQTVYGGIFMVHRDFYAKSNPLLTVYIEALYLLIYEYYQAARTSVCLRDEDITFPPTISNHNTMTLQEILTNLDIQISSCTAALGAQMRFIKYLMLVVIKVLNGQLIDELEEVKAADLKKEKPVGEKKKKKKKAKKADEDAKVVENPWELKSLVKQLSQALLDI